MKRYFLFLIVLFSLGFVSAGAFEIPDSAEITSEAIDFSFCGSEQEFGVDLTFGGEVLAFSVDAEFDLKNKDSFVKIFLIDGVRDKHLVAASVFPDKDVVLLENNCRESCLFENSLDAKRLVVYV